MASQEWLQKNRERLIKYHRDWKARNPEYRRNNHLLKKYGITAIDYDRMLAEQGGGCAICGTKNPGRGKYFFVDHDHRTGMVRGLLCQSHNTMLGHAQDNPEVLRAGASYLEKYRSAIGRT